MSVINRTAGLVKEFGISVTVPKLFQTCTKRIPVIKDIAGKLKYNAITGFLYEENKDILENYNTKSHTMTSKIGNSRVWIFWWQGIEAAPDIVKICVNSIRQNIGCRELVILDKNNYKKYTNLDSYYEHMLEVGNISTTQFSDLLRLNLLFNQGGIWLDSTYLMTGNLPEYVSDLHFFTIRHGMCKEYPMSKGLWTSSALGVAAHADEIKLFMDIYDNYFQKHKTLVDYLLTDYIFAVCCDHCEQVKKMFCRVPVNNIKVNELLKVMNVPYSEALIRTVTDKTVMNKCNRRYPFQSEISNIETIYGHFRKIYL